MYYSYHTGLLTTIAVASLASAQSYSAEPFSLGGMIGKRVQFVSSVDECEWRYWEGPDADCSTSSFNQRFRLLEWDTVIDGFQTNAVLLSSEDVPGAPGYGGSPVILGDTEGFISFGDHPMSPPEREHFINGVTYMPSTFELDRCYPESRADSWEGCWNDNPAVCWTGSLDRTYCVRDFETIEHATLGTVTALRIDSTDSRTKNALDGSRWTTETWSESIWFVEGVGFVKGQWSGVSEVFTPWFEAGVSPLYRSEWDETSDFSLYCLADTNTDGLLDLSDITAFLGAFAAGDLSVDLDASGLLDLADIVAFVDSFQNNC